MMSAKAASRGLILLAAAAVSVGTAAPASADLTWPDPNEPYYWNANENAEGTGPAPLPTDDLYWKEGQDAGGTGNAGQPDQPEYTNLGENAGAY